MTHDDILHNIRKEQLNQLLSGDAHMAGGGLLKAAVKAAEVAKPAVKAVQEVLPLAEREANLAKFMEGSVAPKLYHGTVVRPDSDNVKGMGDIREFDRQFTTKFRKPSLDTLGNWFSDNPGKGGAEMYSGAHEGSAIYPVHVSMKNPHKTTFELMQRRARLLANGEDDGRQIGQAEVDAYRKWLKSMGKDGVVVQDNPGAPNGSTEFQNQSAYITLEPTQIKSATGNRGTYDITDPDITKANGGLIHLAGGGLLKSVVKAAKPAAKAAELALEIRPPSDNIRIVRESNFTHSRPVGNQTVKIGDLSGGVRLSDPQEKQRVKDLADKIASPDGYISRIIVDQDNNVIEGQHRLEALRQLGVQDVPVYKIEDLEATMPVDKMKSAMSAVGPIHSDHVNQLIDHALEHISEGGMDSARQMNYGKFQKHYDAALDAAEQPDITKSGGGLLKKVMKPALKAAEAAPQAEALRLAQQRAALPPAKGGLGLAANNTPEQRAAAMGFDVEKSYIHSARIPFTKINEDGKFSGIFTLPNYSANYGTLDMPLVARGEIATSNDLLRLVKRPTKKIQMAIDEIIPENVDVADATVEMQKLRNELARKYGFSGVKVSDEFGGDTTALVNPDNVRSRFAAFDPFRRSAAIAATMGVAAPDLMAKEQDKAQGGLIHLAGGGDPRKRGLFPKMSMQAIVDSPGFDPEVPSDLSRAYARRIAEKEAYERSMADQKLTPAQRAVAGAEASGMLGSAMFEGVQQLPKLMDGEDAYMKAVGERMYQPRFQPEKAAEYAGNVGDFLEKLETEYKMPQLLPELVPFTGAAEAAKQQAKKAVKQGALTAASRMDAGPTAGSMAAQRGVIKMPGGNWLSGNVEGALKPLKTQTIAGETPAQRIPRHEELLKDPSLNQDQLDRVKYHLEEAKKEAALDKWIDSNLTNYVKKQMGTAEDPVRLLADQGISQFADEGAMRDALNWSYQQATDARKARAKLGMPEDPVSKTNMGRFWETATDELIGDKTISAKEYKRRQGADAPDWLKQVPDETPFYDIAPHGLGSELGFDHIVDVLNEDLAAGRIRPEQLSKVSMEQAVRRTYEYDQEMAKKMAETQAKVTEGMPVHKEYPEGYKWIELAPQPKDALRKKHEEYVRRDFPDIEKYDPWGFEEYVKDSMNSSRVIDQQQLADALKYEGDTMGHCVGGYCPDVLEGRSRIYSLRDAKGEPHVTIEVKPTQRSSGDVNAPRDAAEYQKWIHEEAPPRINQIKGKQNRAPKEEYLPFVQDFVKSGDWSDVGDLRNAGLRDIKKTPKIEEYLKKKGTDVPRYLTENEYQGHESDFLMDQLYPKDETPLPPEQGMAGGGSVGLKNALNNLLRTDKPEVHMSLGGDAAKAALKAAKVKHPLVFPRAAAKSLEDIRPIAQRIAEQMTGDFVRQHPNPKVSTNPAGKSRKQFEREQNIPMETRNLVPPADVPVLDYEKKMGNVLLGVPGDPTLGGVLEAGSLENVAKPTVELTRVGDVTPEHPVPLFGGPRYGNDERFWASNYSAAVPIQNRADKLSELYESPVLGQYIKMAPDSANFALHNLDALLAIQQPEKLPKAKMEKLNREIKAGSPKYGKFPGFVGFKDPIDVLLQSQLDSNLRKHIAETLTKPTITDELGLANGLDVVAAISYPELRNMEAGVSGFSIGELRPKSDLKMSLGEHPTYDTNIPGALIGQSKYPVPSEIAFPDTTAYARSRMTPGVQEFNMLKMLGPRERIDQQYIDEIKMYEELMKQYTGKKKGGLAQTKKVKRHGNTVPH